MANITLRSRNDVATVQVPQSLLSFLRYWSKEGDHKIDHTVLSVLSHGLVSLCALNDYEPDLVKRVSPILNDIVKQAPDDAEVLEMTLTRHVHDDSRN